MAEATVYEGVIVEKNRRNPTSLVDRLKVLLLFGFFFFIMVAYQLNPPFIGWGEALQIALTSGLGLILVVVMGLEVLRQFHYWISEKSAAYKHLWKHSIFAASRI